MISPTFNAQALEKAATRHDQQEETKDNTSNTKTQIGDDKQEFWMWRKPQYWSTAE